MGTASAAGISPVTAVMPLSTPVVRNLLIPAAASTDSKSVSVWTNNFYIVIVEAAHCAAFLTIRKTDWIR